MKEVNIYRQELDYSANESYKSLRTNLLFCGEDKKVIAVTSCTPNEGKSTVSLNLALSLADSGKKVLFIDADLRKSVLMGRTEVEGEEIKGLSHLLSHQETIENVICATNVPRFHIIYAGIVPPIKASPAMIPARRMIQNLFNNTWNNSNTSISISVLSCKFCCSILSSLPTLCIRNYFLWISYEKLVCIRISFFF